MPSRKFVINFRHGQNHELVHCKLAVDSHVCPVCGLSDTGAGTARSSSRGDSRMKRSPQMKLHHEMLVMTVLFALMIGGLTAIFGLLLTQNHAWHSWVNICWFVGLLLLTVGVVINGILEYRETRRLLDLPPRSRGTLYV